ncbi:MAG: Gfo/Idh/MocA family oxidoreductase [Candidatus Aminicenantes bacterium]|nr:Gfo/Idh/MocA family oxidoreductase [Candidatus Aminicenantes bacterium]
MDQPVTIVLSGIGGMGGVYVAELLDRADEGTFRIVGAADPEPRRCPRLADLEALGIPVVPALEDFYAGGRAELAVLSSPIPFHAPQTTLALSYGSRVLCEKPLAATVREAEAMREARDRFGGWVAVGYQWSFSEAIQGLKTDILAGAFGRPKRLSCLYLWPRDDAYYGRSSWAGRIKDAAGRWILDSPANNALAHDLHNMLYVLGPATAQSARPVEVRAELYRANAIENYDTAAVRIRTDAGVEILFLASHAGRRDPGPVLSYEFERATVMASGRGADIKAFFPDGRVRSYGSPDEQPMKKLWDAIASVRNGAAPVCGIEAASAQTLVINGMQDSAPEIVDFPDALRRREETPTGGRIWVEGLDEVFERCYAEGALPSEIEPAVAWTRPGHLITLSK